MALKICHSFFVRGDTFPSKSDDCLCNSHTQNFAHLSGSNKFHEKGLQQKIFILSLAVGGLGPGEHPTVYGSSCLVQVREWGCCLSWLTYACECPFFARFATKSHLDLLMPTSANNVPRAPDPVSVRKNEVMVSSSCPFSWESPLVTMILFFSMRPSLAVLVEPF
jgi:hypothetical protein